MAQNSTSYRKSWKKWVAIYLLVGVIAYAIIYLLFFTGGSGGGGGFGY